MSEALREELRVAKRDKDALEQNAEALQVEAERWRQEAESLQERLAAGVAPEVSEEELLEARDKADRLQFQLEQARRDTEVLVMRSKEAIREELREQHARELAVRDELIALLREKLPVGGGDIAPSVVVVEPDPSKFGGGSTDEDALTGAPEMADMTKGGGPGEVKSPPSKMALPSLPKFSGDKADGEDFDRWVRRLRRHAELEWWSDRQKLLQFELHLTGKAEQLYDLLPADSKSTFTAATESLKGQLHPVQNEALLSAQLMKRKQGSGESVDEYAQELEALFEKSYGRRSGMDHASKELLKRDLFVQGLTLKWQEKVLPSAATFADALHQARAAEEHAKQLNEIHKGTSKASTPRTTGAASGGPSEPRSNPPKTTEPANVAPTSRTSMRGRCHGCGSLRHRVRECPQRQPPSEARGRDGGATSSVVTAAVETQDQDGESLDDRCRRLREEWMAAEHQKMGQ